MKNSRILIINRWFGHKMGGVESHIRQIIKCLLSGGHEVTLLTSGTSHLADLPKTVAVLDVKGAEGYYSLKRTGLFLAVGYIFRVVRQARHLQKQGKSFDCVLTLFSLDAFAARWIRLICGWPYSSLAEENSILEVVETRRADVPAFSNEGIRDMCDASDLAAEIVPLSVDMTDWCPSPDETYRDSASRNATLKLIAVGRLDVRKDHLLLIRAIARIAKSGASVELDICGQGETRPALEREIQTLGLSSIVRLRGFLPAETLPILYGQAHVYVMTSRFEGFGAVYLEAMASGLPIVATAGGATEAIVGDAGIVVYERDPEVVATAILKLWRNKADLFATRRRALERAESFDIGLQKQRIEQWIDHLREVDAGSFPKRLGCFLRGVADVPRILKMVTWGGAVRWSDSKSYADGERGRLKGPQPLRDHPDEAKKA